MAGAGTVYFASKKEQYQAVVDAAQSATQKLAAASQALTILEKETITQAEAEVLISLYEQAQ